MKIVILDGYTENPGDLDWKEISSLGEEFVVYDRTPDDPAIIRERIRAAEAVFTNKTPLSREVLRACPALQFIGVLATGFNIIDLEAAREAGITVCNIPSYGTEAVGQFAIALLLEICHHIGHHDQAVHEGRWSQNADWCFWDYPLIELAGKTMGIIGFGRIGQCTGRIAQALGMRVLAYDQYPNASLESEHCHYADLDTVLRESDVIALHCPLTPETERIINAESLEKMKEGVILLNNSRGPLIDEEALCEALRSGKVAAAGLDVVSMEPIRPDNPLLAAPNCIITPHISWASRESRARLMHIAAENLKAFQAGKPQNVVS